MTSFTLDTNCLLAIANQEPNGAAVRALSAAHSVGAANVAVVAISASEHQRVGVNLTNFDEFQARLDAIGLSRLEILKPMMYWDISFWDWCLWTDAKMKLLEARIHSVLFPCIEFELADYCNVRGLDPRLPPSRKWRNAKCDVQALWSHIYHGRDVFVTADRKFHSKDKKPQLIALGAGKICHPSESAALL